MADQIIARWDSWEDGVGYLYDGDHHGLAWCEGFIGGRGFLSPVASPKSFATRVDAAYHIRHAFINDDASNNPHLYLLTDDGTNGLIQKYSMDSSTYGDDEGSVAYSGNRLGHPVKYKGNWYFTELGGSVMRKLVTTGTGNISGDTITDGDAGSGDGHLITLGHQIAKIQETTGISILKTGGDANTNADWGSDFDVGDPNDLSIGGASLQGLAFVQRGKGLYTFNDRGRAGSIFEDFGAWQQSGVKYWSLVNWKGGLVFSRLDGIYYWRPGILPINISIAARGFPDDPFELENTNGIRYEGVEAIGNFLYVSYTFANTPKTGYLVGEAKGGDPTNIAWWNFFQSSGLSETTGVQVVTDGESVPNGTATTVLVTQAITTLAFYPLGLDGSPKLTTAEYLQTGDAACEVMFPYIELSNKKPTRIRLMIEGIGGTVSPSPTTRGHFEMYGDLSAPTGVGDARTRPMLGKIFQDGITQINISSRLALKDRLSLKLVYIAESSALAQRPPEVRWVEVYGE